MIKLHGMIKKPGNRQQKRHGKRNRTGRRNVNRRQRRDGNRALNRNGHGKRQREVRARGLSSPLLLLLSSSLQLPGSH